MKKILFLPALFLLFCNLGAQNVDNDVLLLQKSNASLKSRLNEQNQILSQQIHTNDSIISILQAANAEIKKNADNQKSTTLAVSKLQEQSASTGKVLADISNAFGKRKMYALISGFGFLICVALLFFYFKNKLTALNAIVKQNEENFNGKIMQTNEFMDKEIGGMKLQFEKESVENKSMVTKQFAASDERMNKMTSDVGKTIESQILSVKGMVQEQFSKSAIEFNEKIMELNKTIDKKIAAIEK